MKKGDRVEFKTPSGKIIKGIYEGKTEQRAIIKGGKKTYKPPLKLVKKSKAEPKKAKKEDEVRPVDKKVPKTKNITGDKKPKGVPKPDKETLQVVMGIMSELGKEQKKSTQKQKDEGLKFDKKIRDGKLTFKDFGDLVFYNNSGETSEIVYDFEEEMSDVQGYNMGYWISRVSKRADDYDDLTEKQKERLQDIMMKDIHKQTKAKLKSFYEERIKGKKFKKEKDIFDLFKKHYAETTFDY